MATDDLVTIPLTVLNALHANDRRYRWLKQFARGVNLTMNGQSNWHIGGEAIRHRAPSVDAAIDKHLAEIDAELEQQRRGTA